MQVRQRAIHIGMWTCAIVTGFMVCLWIVSHWVTFDFRVSADFRTMPLGRGATIGGSPYQDMSLVKVASGAVQISVFKKEVSRSAVQRPRVQPGWTGLVLLPHAEEAPWFGVTYFDLPFWPAALGMTGVSVYLWRHQILAYRRKRKGACPVCGYDRRGLGTEAACPECGTRPVILSGEEVEARAKRREQRQQNQLYSEEEVSNPGYPGALLLLGIPLSIVGVVITGQSLLTANFIGAGMYALLTLVPGVSLIVKSVRARRAQRGGHSVCSRCRYDRSMLASDAACPECGTEPK